MATLIDSEPAVALAVVKGVFTTGTPAERNPLLDITFWCMNRSGAGYGKAWATASSDTTGSEYTGTCIGYATASGTGIQGNVIGEDEENDGTVADTTVIAYAIAKGTPWVGPPTVGLTSNSFVRWSDKDGHMIMDYDDVETNKSNLAGERPMPFGDVLYRAKKLGSVMVIYGKNGIAVMQPSGLFWGVKTLRTDRGMRIGLRSMGAVCGNDDWHMFLDREKILWEFTLEGGLKPHDYSNQLASMDSKTVLTFDERKNIVYICDGTRGFCWTPSGLGKCPINITGMGYKGGTFYVTAPASIANSAIQIWTDIWDGGSRDDKEIMSIGLATDVAQDLYGSIAYRWDKAEAFNTTPWVKATKGGMVNVTASGVEFKFGVKLNTYAYMRLDRMDVEVQYSELKPIMVGE